MASDREPVRFVTASAVRSEVVTVLGESRVPTQSLLETLDASTSAVHNSLSELEQRGLIRSAEEGWELTGSGRLVADMVRQRERCGDVLHAPETEPNRAVEEVLLSLPTLDGSYDAQSELIAEYDPTRRWGEDLFERYWGRGVPIDQFANASERGFW